MSEVDNYLDKLDAVQKCSAVLQGLLGKLKMNANTIESQWRSIGWHGKPGFPINIPALARYRTQPVEIPTLPTVEEIAEATNAFLSALIEAHQAFGKVPAERRKNLQKPSD